MSIPTAMYWIHSHYYYILLSIWSVRCSHRFRNALSMSLPIRILGMMSLSLSSVVHMPNSPCCTEWHYSIIIYRYLYVCCMWPCPQSSILMCVSNRVFMFFFISFLFFSFPFGFFFFSTVKMFNSSWRNFVPVSKSNLRKCSTISTWTESTWNGIFATIFDDIAVHRFANHFTWDSIRSIFRTRIGAFMASIANFTR